MPDDNETPPVDPVTEDTVPMAVPPEPPAEPNADPAGEEASEEAAPTDDDIIAKAVEVQTIYAQDYPWVVAHMDTVALKIDEGNAKNAEHERFFDYKPAQWSAYQSLIKADGIDDVQFRDDMTAMYKDTIAYIVDDLARDRKDTP